MESAIETETPMERLRRIAFPLIAPLVISSTWRVSTCTAGSAATINQPITAPIISSAQE